MKLKLCRELIKLSRDRKTAQWIGEKTKVRDIKETISNLKRNCAGHVEKRTAITSGRFGDTQGTEEDQGRDGRTTQIVS